MPLVRSHGLGFGPAVFSWLLQDVASLTHWAVPDTLGNLGSLDVEGDAGTHPHTHSHTHDHELKTFHLQHVGIDWLLHMSPRQHTGLSLVC